MNTDKVKLAMSNFEPTEKELAVIHKMMDESGLSYSQVIRQAIRTYQLIQTGHAKLVMPETFKLAPKPRYDDVYFAGVESLNLRREGHSQSYSDLGGYECLPDCPMCQEL